jgi:hypothetical protein
MDKGSPPGAYSTLVIDLDRKSGDARKTGLVDGHYVEKNVHLTVVARCMLHRRNNNMQ